MRGLPVFRYVAIETTEYETGDNLPQFEKYERIAIVNAIIESLASYSKSIRSHTINITTRIWLIG